MDKAFTLAQDMYSTMLREFGTPTCVEGTRNDSGNSRRVAFALTTIITSVEAEQEIKDQLGVIAGAEYYVTIGKTEWLDESRPRPGDIFKVKHLPPLYCIAVTNTYYGFKLRCTTKESDSGNDQFDF